MIRGNVIANEVAWLGVGQPIVDPELVVDEGKILWTSQHLYWREILHGCAAGLLQLSKQNPRILVGLITKLAKDQYHRYNTRKADTRTVDSVA